MHELRNNLAVLFKCDEEQIELEPIETGHTTVPFKTVELFTNKMKENGNSCTLIAYKDEPHGFFNYGKNLNGPFIDTVNKMDKFLVSLGYLKAPPQVSIQK